MLKARLTLALMGALMVGLACGVGNMALATLIGPGFDLFATDPSTTSVDVNLGAGLVTIPLKGVPIGASLGPDLGDTDTIVERKLGISLDPPSGTGAIPIELVALSLASVSPVDIGGTFFDLMVIGGTLLGGTSPGLGSMTITHTTPAGGTFTSTLPVNATLTFTPVGGGTPTVSSFSDTLTTPVPGSWSHTPGPMDVHPPLFPAGFFYPGVILVPDPSGPPGAVMPAKELTKEESLLARHGVFPAMPRQPPPIIPEPSSLVLFCIGILGVLGYGWKRRKRTA